MCAVDGLQFRYPLKGARLILNSIITLKLYEIAGDLPPPPPGIGCSAALGLVVYGWPFSVRLWKAEWLLFMMTASTFRTKCRR